MAGEIFVVRGVAKELRQRLKQEAAREQISISQAVSMAIKEWLDKQSEESLNFENIKRIKGIIKGGKRESWGRNIDKILYG